MTWAQDMAMKDTKVQDNGAKGERMQWHKKKCKGCSGQRLLSSKGVRMQAMGTKGGGAQGHERQKESKSART